MKSRKGFTLAELLIVIAVIAILIAIAIPSFSGALDGARLAVDATTERNALNAAKIKNVLFQTELGSSVSEIRAALKEQGYSEEQIETKIKEGWYFFYNPTTGELDPAFDDPGAEHGVISDKVRPYIIGKWGYHKDKYLMVLIQVDGTIRFRWGHDKLPGTDRSTYWGFTTTLPSVEELQKRRG